MKLIGANKIITCNKHFDIIDNGGILFNEKEIIKIDDFKKLEKQYAIKGEFYDSCVITPAFINSHIHFEFSANETTLQYGSFGNWLDSVIINRNSLMQDSITNNPQKYITQAIKDSMKSGVGCVGAVSSNGLDLEILHNSPLKVMFFNEIMGSDPNKIDLILEEFNTRLDRSMAMQNNKFKVGIALHSPYSLHTELAKAAIFKAKKHKMLLSTHFLESKEELEWIEYNKGYFSSFFKRFFNTEASAAHSKESFINLFQKTEVLFVHCLYANNDDFAKLSKLNADIISSPRSNRLLNNKYFDFLQAQNYGFEMIISTDGKSSNNSISMLDEARVALFAYPKFNLENLAKDVLLAMSSRPAKRLRFNNGVISKGKASDFAIFHIKDISTSNQVALQTLLHAREVEDLYINGKRINIENY